MARRRRKALPAPQRGCEFHPDGKSKPCGQPPVAFAMGIHRCAAHLPPAQPKCSHSLAPSGRCAFCGQEAT